MHHAPAASWRAYQKWYCNRGGEGDITSTQQLMSARYSAVPGALQCDPCCRLELPTSTPATCHPNSEPLSRQIAVSQKVPHRLHSPRTILGGLQPSQTFNAASSPSPATFSVTMAKPSPSPHKPRRKAKQAVSSISNIHNVGTVETMSRAPAFPLAAFLWPARGTVSQWELLPLILMAVGLFRWAAGLWGYSGATAPEPWLQWVHENSC